MPGSRVQVNAMCTFADDLVDEGVGHPPRQRTFGRAGKGAIQVAPVR